MKTRIRATAVLVGLPAMLACCSPAGASAAAGSAVSPLPASDYTVRHVCAAPAPGYAGCLALELVPRTAAARAHTHPLGITRSRPIEAANPTEGAFGLRPRDLLSAYNLPLPPQPASTQTIALVDAYNDPNAEADLKVYDEEFGLPECTGANKCFEQVNQNGETGNPPFPASEAARAAEEVICETAIEETKEAACKEVEEADGWTGEISLDIEVAHAICQNCHIVLVEANLATFFDLGAAEQTAVKSKIAGGVGATEISDSWGGSEQGITAAEDDAGPFNHPGTVITVAAGDNGYLDWAAEEPSERGFADYPASSPHVVAVGGTRLSLTTGGEWAGETVWNGDGAGGSGCSSLAAPAWQTTEPDWSTVGCGSGRAVADVSADADPYTGVAIYDSTPERMGEGAPGWVPIGGTSLASPLVASTFALAGGAGGVAYPAQTLYENELDNPTSLHDVTSGSNGKCEAKELFNEETGLSNCEESFEAADCSGSPICNAGPGYDGPTGVGTPNGITAFEPVSEEVRRTNEEKRRAEAKLREERHLEEKKKEEEEEEAAAAKNQGGGSGGEAREGFAGLSLPPGAHPSGPSLSIPGSSSVLPILSAASLTHKASIALRHGPLKISRIAFAFTLNVPARVQVTLAEQVLAHGHRRWRSLPDSLAIIAAKGRNRANLHARGTLSPGRYRLTLTPLHGRLRSISFRIA
jgi:hypothetical protein